MLFLLSSMKTADGWTPNWSPESSAQAINAQYPTVYLQGAAAWAEAQLLEPLQVSYN